MGRCKPMYGFDEKETECLRRRFIKLSQEETGWADVDAFLRWASETGYEKGLHIGKDDDALPHGPGNSCWINKDQVKMRYLKRIKEGCEFCKGCEKKCSLSALGCKEWQNYFVKNWNKHISIAKPVPVQDPNVTKYFRYEHPDLVREGIVWSGS